MKSILNKLLRKKSVKQIRENCRCREFQSEAKDLLSMFDDEDDFYLVANFGYCALCIYEIFEIERDEWLCLLKKEYYPSKIKRKCFRSKW